MEALSGLLHPHRAGWKSALWAGGDWLVTLINMAPSGNSSGSSVAQNWDFVLGSSKAGRAFSGRLET
jgi:hypothetical protein